MKKRNLIIGRSIFTLAIIIIFGLILMQEKGSQIFTPKIKKKFSSYVDKNYKNQQKDFIINKITYNNYEFQTKITSKKNKNLYFTLKYINGNIKDTYKKDYKEGKSLLSYLNKKLSNEIYTKTNQKCTVNNISTLDKYTEKVQEKIINEDNLLTLKYYYIEKEIITDKWTSQEITKAINDFITKNETNNITPKYYSFIITNKDNVINSIKISHIKSDFPKNNNNIYIIDDIINKNKSSLLQQSEIKYYYLNEEE